MRDPLPPEFYLNPTVQVARDLIGSLLARRLPDGRLLSGTIVETEAYVTGDPASHAFGGRTPRNAAMWGPPGSAYVYLSYGMHQMLNIVCGPEGVGEAVLIRALEPVEGIEAMRAARGGIESRFALTNGPGKLAQALLITRAELNGVDVTRAGGDIALYPRRTQPDISAGARIGITKGTEFPYRFFVAGNPYVSKGRPSVAVS